MTIYPRYKRSPYGMACTECNELLIAPNRSEYVSEHEVRHFWDCEICSQRSEIAVDLRANVTPQPDKHVL
jgi:hypothetical protein